jgi:long-chain acyl-CoA synthetase
MINKKKEEKSKIKNEYPWFKYYKDMESHIDYPDVSMYELVRRCSLKYPSNIAYTYFGNKVTYKTYVNKIDEAACAFARMGVKRGSNITVIMPNTPEAITCFYALNKIGAVVNIMHPLSSEEELKHGIKITNAEYLMIADLVYEKIKSIRQEIDVKKIVYVSVAESMDPITKLGFMITKGRKIKRPYGENVISYFRFISRARYYKERILDIGKGNDSAVILHSGGTTGKPKGILLTNMNFNSLVLSELEINKVLGDGISILAIMPIFHGFGLGCTFHACMVSGGTAIILPSVNPKKFDSTLLKYKPNILACVPSILEGLTISRKLRDEDLSFIKCIICGGDTLSANLNEKIDEFLYDHGSDTHVRTAFGMTECTAGVTMMPLEETRKESIGIPCPDCYIKICKINSSEECEMGEVGEICINGPTVMKEYINEPKETSMILKKHSDGKLWLHSGDLGSMDADGFVYFKSRLKRMIISSGYNIYPGQIEQIISEHQYVKACAVVGVPHPYKKEVAKAYIVLKDGIELSGEVKKSIKEHCEKNIASYALPYSYGYRKELPKTLIGKIAYRELINSKGEEEDGR